MLPTPRTFLASLMMAALLAAGGRAAAAGFFLPVLPKEGAEYPALAVRTLHVEAVVQPGGTVTTATQLFYNGAKEEIKGSFIFPLPEGVEARDLVVRQDGKPVEARLLPKGELRARFEAHIRRGGAPGVLAFLDRAAYEAELSPVKAEDDTKVEVCYTGPAPPASAPPAYTCPLAAAGITDRPPREVSAHVVLEGATQLATALSSTHSITSRSEGLNRVTASYVSRGRAPTRDLHVYAIAATAQAALMRPIGLLDPMPKPTGGALSPRVGVNVFTYQPPPRLGGKAEDPFFAIVLNAESQVQQALADQVLMVPKDLTFVLDCSGSMTGARLEQAKLAIKYLLGRLHPGDRFNIVPFQAGVQPLSPVLVPLAPLPSGESPLEYAYRYLDQLRAGGLTDINEALLTSLAMQDPQPGRPSLVVALTDGQPTTGERSLERILENVAMTRRPGTRVFVLATLTRGESSFLNRLAWGNGGEVEYARPRDDLRVKLISFVSRIASAVLRDVGIDLGGAGAYDVYPSELAALYGEEPVVVVGRYREPGAHPLTVRGTAGEVPSQARYTVEMPGDPRAEFIGRLWAAQRMEALAEEILQRGQEQMARLREEMARLNLDYGVPVPAGFPGMPGAGLRQTPGMPPMAATGVAAMGMPGRIPGMPDLGTALARRSMALAGHQADLVAQILNGQSILPREPDDTPARRHVRGKVFDLREGVWVDSAYNADLPRKDVAYASDAYFERLRKEPELAPYLALGERVKVVWKDEAVVVAPETKAEEKGEAPAAAAPAGK